MKITKHTRLRATSHSYLWKAGDVESIASVKQEYCCDNMAEAFKDQFIVFGEYDSMLNRDRNVNIVHCSPYPEGAVWDEMAINFCPFCAAPIEITERPSQKPV